jgi:hypothetical protein
VTDPLVAELARLLDREPAGLPCEELSRRVHRRRVDVVAALAADPRFVHVGQTRRSRWRLAARIARPTSRDGMGRNHRARPDLDASGVPVIGRTEQGAS